MGAPIYDGEWSRSALVVLAGLEKVNAKQVVGEALFEELVPLFAPLGKLGDRRRQPGQRVEMEML
jgi:hypothetical protein